MIMRANLLFMAFYLTVFAFSFFGMPGSQAQDIDEKDFLDVVRMEVKEHGEYLIKDSRWPFRIVDHGIEQTLDNRKEEVVEDEKCPL